VLNFLTRKSSLGSDTPRAVGILTSEDRDELISHLVANEGMNPYRLMDQIGNMRRKDFWEFPQGDENMVPEYNQAQKVYCEQLWRTQYPDTGFATLHEAVSVVAVACYEARNDNRSTGRVSGEEDWVECYPVTDTALAWITQQLPALTILQVLDAEEYRFANLSIGQVEALAKHALKSGGAADREGWIAEWWQYQMRFYVRIHLKIIEAAAQEKLAGSTGKSQAASTGGDAGDLVTP
jgi:hypothetical protein